MPGSTLTLELDADCRPSTDDALCRLVCLSVPERFKVLTALNRPLTEAEHRDLVRDFHRYSAPVPGRSPTQLAARPL